MSTRSKSSRLSLQDDERLVIRRAGELAGTDVDTHDAAIGRRPDEQPAEVHLDALDLALCRATASVNTLVFLPGDLEPPQVGFHLHQGRLVREVGEAFPVPILCPLDPTLEQGLRTPVADLGVVEPRLGLLYGRLGRRDIPLLGCGHQPIELASATARFALATASWVRKSRSSSRKSGSPFFTSPPRLTYTSLTTPATRVPIGRFSSFDSTRPTPWITGVPAQAGQGGGRRLRQRRTEDRRTRLHQARPHQRGRLEEEEGQHADGQQVSRGFLQDWMAHLGDPDSVRSGRKKALAACQLTRQGPHRRHRRPSRLSDLLSFLSRSSTRINPQRLVLRNQQDPCRRPASFFFEGHGHTSTLPYDTNSVRPTHRENRPFNSSRARAARPGRCGRRAVPGASA